jgi:diguanylate cyclase (GGDEF)-like protein
MIFVFDVLNILFISGSRSIETKEPIWSCFSRIVYAERKSVLPQRVFLSIVSMLLSSFMGDVALVIVFIGVLFLGFQDVLHKELVEKIEEADIDPLTGVYNMRYLHRWMTAELSLMPGVGPEFSLIFADIDGLKTVNDTYGHETGNELLIYFSKILKDTVRKQDRVARYGGDEFIVVCPATTLEQAQVAALRILRAMGERPFLVDQAILEFGVSMGVAAWPEHGETVSDLIRVADKAMYLAKKDGGNTVRTALDL